jgi:hypothetical protein
MPFEKNDPRINKGGRPTGQPNRTTEQLRKAVQSFLDRNIDTLQADFDLLEPKDRLTFIDRLLKHVLPSLQSITLETDLSKLSDEQIGHIVTKLLKPNDDENIGR